MTLPHLRISGRLYAGFGILVAATAFLAAVGFWQLGSIKDSVELMTLQSKVSVRVGEMTTDLQAIRRGLLRYSFDQDEASLADADKRMGAVVALLEEAAATTRFEERKSEYKNVIGDINQLKANRVELGDAVKQMQAGRALLFTDGDTMADDVAKFVAGAAGTAFVADANALETKVLLTRIANWRMLATRNAKGIETFKINLAKALADVARIEKLELPANLAAQLTLVKSGLTKYGEAFEKTGPNIVRADQLYYNAITPAIVGAIGKMQKIKSETDTRFVSTVTETNGRIDGTVSAQEIIAAVAVLLGLAIAFFIARGIIGPLAGLTAGMKELAGGNFDVVLPGLDRRDEVAEMAHAVSDFKVKAEQKARDEAEAKIRQDEVVARQRKEDMQKLASGFEEAVGAIVHTVSAASSQLEASARTMTSQADHAQELATTVASASEEASANVQSVATATEELSSSISEISRQVLESTRMAGAAVDQAHNTTSRVGELSKAATRIGDVVELINTIAGQTNLLALNATIEAARAGEAGRGFAVVASEVKALAEQTSKATGEISQQISGIQAATEDSVGAIREISGTIEKLSEISSAIAAAVEEQGAATQEIARNVQQAATGTQQVSANIADVQRGAAETGSASSQVLSAAQTLSTDSGRLRSEVSKFLASVRAA